MSMKLFYLVDVLELCTPHPLHKLQDMGPHNFDLYKLCSHCTPYLLNIPADNLWNSLDDLCTRPYMSTQPDSLEHYSPYLVHRVRVDMDLCPDDNLHMDSQQNLPYIYKSLDYSG